MKSINEYKGIHVPVVTCFDLHSNRLNEIAQKKVLEYVLNQQKADAIIACATTGEAGLLDDMEYQQIAKFILNTARKIKKDCLVMLGTTSLNPRETIKRNQFAVAEGFNGVLLSPPPYIKPDQRGIKSFFKEVANTTPTLPIFLYNIWYRTGGKGISPETIIDLAKIDNIYGIKDCGVSIEHMDQVIQGTDKNSFLYLTGEDANVFDVLTHGGDGAIVASGHIVGKELKQLLKLVQEHKLCEALTIHKKIKPLIQALFLEPNPAPLKFCLKQLGIEVGEPRPPAILPITKATQLIIRQELAKLIK